MTTPADMTIDEFARDADLPVSTVRMYQNKGLLAPPEKRGRVGYYSQSHRDRLRLINHLQDRGFSLAAIREALDSWNAGRSLNHLLGVGDIAPSMAREPLRLSPAEMAQRFEGIGLTQADTQRAVELGLVEIDGTDVVVSSRAFAEIGPEVARLGVPIDQILDEYEALQQSVADIADRFRSIFDEHVWQPYAERGIATDEISQIAGNVEKLTELATAVVTAELHRRFADFAEEYISEATE